MRLSDLGSSLNCTPKGADACRVPPGSREKNRSPSVGGLHKPTKRAPRALRSRHVELAAGGLFGKHLRGFFFSSLANALDSGADLFSGH